MTPKTMSALLSMTVAATEAVLVQDNSSTLRAASDYLRPAPDGNSLNANSSTMLPGAQTYASSTSAPSELATINYNGVISYNGTDPFNIVAESRSSSFGLPIETQLFMCLLYGMLTFIAVTSNVIVCYIVLSNQRMRTATNYFIVNLAVGDILMALLCIPFTFPANLIFQYWPFGFTLCVLVSYSQANSVFISAYTMVAISIDKYLAIMYPMRLRMSKTQAKIIILVIWSAALVTSLPTALLSSIEPLGFDSSNSTFETSAPPWPTSPLIVTQSLTTNTGAPASWLPPQQEAGGQMVAQNQVNKTPSPTTALINDELKPTTAAISAAAAAISTSTSTSTSSGQQQQQQQQLEAEQQPQIQQQGQRKYICQESWSFWPQGKYYYSMALMILQFVLPLFVLVITYSRIVIVVWGKRMPGEEDNARDARMARSKRKMIKMVIFCVIAFALTWLPFNALIVIGDVQPAIWENSNIMYIWFVTHYLAMCHTITNPLIYIWMNNRFRAGFGQVIEDLYMAAKLAFVYLWFYCCCMGCILSDSRVKQRRVASNLRQKRAQQMPSSSCLATNPATNFTPPNNTHSNKAGNSHAANPQHQSEAHLDGFNDNETRKGCSRVENKSAVTSRSGVGEPQTLLSHKSVSTQQVGSNQEHRPTPRQSTLREFSLGDTKEEDSPKQRKKGHICLLTGRRRRKASCGAGSGQRELELAEKLERSARKKRRRRAQSHVINLCLTSTQTAGDASCFACKQQSPSVKNGNKGKQREFGIRGPTGRPFIADMCRSSQSTATLSIQTNTTSLAMSPLCSRRNTANNTNNNTSASSGEQATDMTHKSEPVRCRHRAKRKSEQRTSSSDKELEEQNKLRYDDARLAHDGDSSSSDSLNDEAKQLKQWNNNHHYCASHSINPIRSVQRSIATGFGPDLDCLETTDDDVADVVFQQTASLDSNNRRGGSNSIGGEHSDEQLVEFGDDDENLVDEYDDSRRACPEFVPMVRLRGPMDSDRRKFSQNAQGSRLTNHTKLESPDQRSRMQLLKRLFRSMGEDLERNPNPDDRQKGVADASARCMGNHTPESHCRLPEQKSFVKPMDQSASSRGTRTSNANKNNYQQITTPNNSQNKTVQLTTNRHSNFEQQQRARSLRRTMLLNNHLISSTSRIPDHLACGSSLSRETFPLVDKDVISSNGTKSTPSVLKQSEKALSGCGFYPACISPEQADERQSGTECDDPHFAPTKPTSAVAKATQAQCPRRGGDKLEFGWDPHERSDIVAASDHRNHQSSSVPASSQSGARDLLLIEDGTTWIKVNTTTRNGTGSSSSQVRLATKSTKKACSLDTDDGRRRLIVPPDHTEKGLNSTDCLTRSAGNSLEAHPKFIEEVRGFGVVRDTEIRGNKSSSDDQVANSLRKYERGANFVRSHNGLENGVDNEITGDAKLVAELSWRADGLKLHPTTSDSQIWPTANGDRQIVQ